MRKKSYFTEIKLKSASFMGHQITLYKEKN